MTDVEYGGHTYRTEPLGAIEGSVLLVRIAQCIAPAVATGGDTAAVTKALFAVDASDTFRAACETFARRTTLVGVGPLWTAENKGALFDVHFRGRYDALVAWFAACVGENYGPFFATLAGPGAAAFLRGMGIPVPEKPATPTA